MQALLRLLIDALLGARVIRFVTPFQTCHEGRVRLLTLIASSFLGGRGCLPRLLGAGCTVFRAWRVRLLCYGLASIACVVLFSACGCMGAPLPLHLLLVHLRVFLLLLLEAPSFLLPSRQKLLPMPNDQQDCPLLQLELHFLEVVKAAGHLNHAQLLPERPPHVVPLQPLLQKHGCIVLHLFEHLGPDADHHVVFPGPLDVQRRRVPDPPDNAEP